MFACVVCLQGSASSEWAITINLIHWTPDFGMDPWVGSGLAFGSVSLLRRAPRHFAARGMVRGIMQSEGTG